MVTEYGMSSKLGAVRYGTEHGDPFLGRTMGTQADYSHEVAQIIDDEVRKLIEAAHTEAWEILTEYRDVLDTLAGELLEKETLHRAELRGDLRRRRRSGPRLTMFDDFGGRIPSDKPPIKTPGELAIERGEPWPQPVPEPAFKAAIAQASARPRAEATDNANGANGVRRQRNVAERPHAARLRCPGRLARAGLAAASAAARASIRRTRQLVPAAAAAAGYPASRPAGPPPIRRISPIPYPGPQPPHGGPTGAPVSRTTRTRTRNRAGLTRRPTADRTEAPMTRPHSNSATFTTPDVRPTARRGGDPRAARSRSARTPTGTVCEDTPARVARAYKEMFAGLYTDPDTVLNTTFDEQHDELVLVKEIPLYSTCEHHLVAFHGVAHVGYIPGEDGRVTGLSKIARLVDLYAKRPQVQERLTAQIADALMRKLDPRGVIVVVEAEHLCMAMRGVRKPGAITTTSAVRGQFKTRCGIAVRGAGSHPAEVSHARACR